MSAFVSYEDGWEQNVSLDESYWSAVLTEGEFARSKNGADSPLEVDILSDMAEEKETLSAGADEAIWSDAERDWHEIQQIMREDGILVLTIIGYNRGGLLVEWRSLRGFVPASQLTSFPATNDPASRKKAMLERVGTTLHLRVIELDQAKNRLIFSERAAQVGSGVRARLLHELISGDTIQGIVTNLCDFGAFVDVGGVEGLIHISELSWGRVNHPADILKRGQEIDVFILDVIPEESRIALSIKRLNPDPWLTVQDRYRIGEIVEGHVTNVVDFGAFACIEEGLEGLIHFSELAEGHFLHPRNVVQEGDMVRARILSIDGKARRLGLSLRNL